MARTWTSGTAVDGGGSTPANAAVVQTAIRDAIVANAAWSLVEEIAGTTNRVMVFKCAAASSGLAADFYVAVWRDVAGGSIAMSMGENYNSGTHVLTNPVPFNTGGTRVIDANGLVTTTPPSLTFNAATGVVTNAATTGTNSVALAATAFWSVVCDVDHVVITIRTLSVYLGAVTSLSSVADPMPIGMILCTGGATPPNSGSAMTRNVGGTSPAVAGAFNVYDLANGTVVFGAGQQLLPFASADKIQNNLPHAYEMVVAHQTSQAATNGFLRGKVKALAYVSAAPAGTAIGDTFTMGGHTWMVVGMNGTSAILCDTGS